MVVAVETVTMPVAVEEETSLLVELEVSLTMAPEGTVWEENK